MLGSGHEAARRVISAQGSRWFGALPPASVACDWSDGFVRELRLKADVPSELTGRALFSRHSLGFLRTLKLDAGARPSLFGIEALLRELLAAGQGTPADFHGQETFLDHESWAAYFPGHDNFRGRATCPLPPAPRRASIG